MRIGMISDIHVDVNHDFNIVENLCIAVQEKNIQCLIIAGDISNKQSLTIETINRIRELSGIDVYFVPGNHDMWDERNEYNDAFTIYKNYASHPSCLSSGAKALSDDLILIGDIGWYDYSFGDKQYTFEDFERMHAFNRTWKDSEYVKWNKSNKEMTEYFIKKLTVEMERYKNKDKILVTHMISRKEFTVPAEREIWKYFNAFLGSSHLGILFEEYKVKYAIMGHVHYREHKKINDVNYVCSCLNYYTEWQANTKDCLQEIRQSLFVAEL